MSAIRIIIFLVGAIFSFFTLNGAVDNHNKPKHLVFVGIDIQGSYYYQALPDSSKYTAIGITAFAASPAIDYEGAPTLKLFIKKQKDTETSYEQVGSVDVTDITSGMVLISETKQKTLRLNVMNSDWEKFPAGHYRICNLTTQPIGVKVGPERFIVPVNGSRDGESAGGSETFFASYTEINGTIQPILKNVFFFRPKQRNTALVIESDSDYFSFKIGDSEKKVKGDRYHLVMIPEDATAETYR